MLNFFIEMQWNFGNLGIKTNFLVLVYALSLTSVVCAFAVIMCDFYLESHDSCSNSLISKAAANDKTIANRLGSTYINTKNDGFSLGTRSPERRLFGVDPVDVFLFAYRSFLHNFVSTYINLGVSDMFPELIKAAEKGGRMTYALLAKRLSQKHKKLHKFAAIAYEQLKKDLVGPDLPSINVHLDNLMGKIFTKLVLKAASESLEESSVVVLQAALHNFYTKLKELKVDEVLLTALNEVIKNKTYLKYLDDIDDKESYKNLSINIGKPGDDKPGSEGKDFDNFKETLSKIGGFKDSVSQYNETHAEGLMEKLKNGRLVGLSIESWKYLLGAMSDPSLDPIDAETRDTYFKLWNLIVNESDGIVFDERERLNSCLNAFRSTVGQVYLPGNEHMHNYLEILDGLTWPEVKTLARLNWKMKRELHKKKKILGDSAIAPDYTDNHFDSKSQDELNNDNIETINEEDDDLTKER